MLIIPDCLSFILVVIGDLLIIQWLCDRWRQRSAWEACFGDADIGMFIALVLYVYAILLVLLSAFLSVTFLHNVFDPQPLAWLALTIFGCLISLSQLPLPQKAQKVSP